LNINLKLLLYYNDKVAHSSYSVVLLKKEYRIELIKLTSNWLHLSNI